MFVQVYGRGADAANRLTSVTLARSTDGGRTFTNYQWPGAPKVAVHFWATILGSPRTMDECTAFGPSRQRPTIRRARVVRRRRSELGG